LTRYRRKQVLHLCCRSIQQSQWDSHSRNSCIHRGTLRRFGKVSKRMRCYLQNCL